jgi:RNA polymerase sigma factor (sigma-70 family)
MVRHPYDGPPPEDVTVNTDDLLADHFEAHRAHLRAGAYRMLGSLDEADDAVQEGWLRLSRSESSEIDNLGGWLTTVVSRVCLDMLRSRTARREDALDLHEPDPAVVDDELGHPEGEALLADSVGVAMLVVLDRLAPAERLAFVLHDMFGVPFDEIGSNMGRTSTAARQLASGPPSRELCRNSCRVMSIWGPAVRRMGKERKWRERPVASNLTGRREEPYSHRKET